MLKEMETNKRAKYVISSLLLSVIAKMNVRERSWSDLDGSSTNFGWSELWPLVSESTPKRKTVW